MKYLLVDPPRITAFPEIGPIRTNADFVVSCRAIGVPSPVATLYLNDEEIFGGFTPVVHHKVTNAGRSDNGTYTCTASSISKITGQPFPLVSRMIEVLVQGLQAL